MRRLLTSLTLGLLALLVLAFPTSAATRVWCARDPIVSLNSKSVQILIAVPDDKEALVNGALYVEVKSPKGVGRAITFLDTGFNGYGETVKFSDSPAKVASDGSIPIEITAKAPVDKKLSGGGPIEMQVTVIFANGTSQVFYGTSDNTLLKTTVPAR